MRKRLYKGDHPDLATSLHNLAQLYKSLGRLPEAEPLHQEALGMIGRLYKGDHPHVAASLQSLASHYHSQGRYSEAEPLLEEALAMTKRLFKGDHPDLATSLHNLAELYRLQKRLVEAEPLYQQALAMRKRLFAGDHPHVAASLNGLAGLYKSLGRDREAEPLYQQALTITKRLFQSDHPYIATGLNNLALLYCDQGKYSKAEPLYNEALAMTQRLFQGDHPDVAGSLNNLAGLLAATNRPHEALIHIQEALTVEQKIMCRVFAYSSESDRLRHLKSIRTTFDSFLSLIFSHFFNSPEAVTTALDVILQRKGLSAAAVAAFNFAIYSDRYSHLTEQFQQWKSLNEQITHLTFCEPTPENRQYLTQLKQKAEQLEKYLASKVPEIQLQDQTINRLTVAQQLPLGSSLIEFVRFRLFDFANQKWDGSRYLAFILPARQPDKVTAIDLGEAVAIEKLIELSRTHAIAYVNTASGRLVRFDGEKLGISLKRKPSSKRVYDSSAAIKLRQAIFDPIEEYLRDSQQLLISPDGELSLLPFQLLAWDDGGQELFIDRYSISYISAGRDLFRSQAKTNRPPTSPTIIADPQFRLNLTPSQTPQQHRETAPTEQQLKTLNLLKNETFPRAEGTALMAQKIADILEIEPYLQHNAVTTHLTSDRCPEILLIATHGLYFSQEEDEPLPHAGKVSNPMLRSGLAFAGVENWIQDGTLPTEVGKGFLFAQDIAQLDLWGNEITVMCACQSGVGDTSIGEGVFGLRRAFAVAGAKTLIMSLWSVPEKASVLLMERFFGNLLNNGMRRGTALKEAQNYIRHITVKELRQSELGLQVLEELPSFRSKTTGDLHENVQPLTHPFYWGAWICQGASDNI